MSIYSTLLLIIFFLIFFKRNNDKKFWVIFLYVVISLISDVLLSLFQFYQFYLFSFFTLVEYTIFSYFFYLSYKEKTFKHLIIWCYPVFCLVLVYSIMYNYKSYSEFDYLSSSLEAILIIIFSILFFYEQLKNPEVNFIYDSKSFWVITAFLIYMSATLFLFISTSALSTNTKQTQTVWLINNAANIIKNILFGIAFCKHLTLAIDSSCGKLTKISLRKT